MKTSSLTNAFLPFQLPLALVLLIAVVVAGILPWSDGTAHAAPSHPAKRSNPILWKPCGQFGAQCGQVSVPVDWNNSDGPHIKLAVALLRASHPSQPLTCHGEVPTALKTNRSGISYVELPLSALMFVGSK